MRPKIVFMLIVAFVMMPCYAICETIDWKKYSEGVRLARKQNKKIFLHFRTDWCRYCDQMEQTTFKDKSVGVFLNEHFVSIKVDGDREKSIAKTHKVTGFPDNRFLDEKIKEAFRLPGFVEPMTFLFFLEYIQTNSYKTMDPMQYYKSR
ncbi:MAG: hypothetical protein DRH93_20795 [Deltaproteobacteria bacterium]|nr:MAG: hypothetical protein DRH93_20795 [Deltaproteobacteria bacterium]